MDRKFVRKEDSGGFCYSVWRESVGLSFFPPCFMEYVYMKFGGVYVHLFSNVCGVD